MNKNLNDRLFEFAVNVLKFLPKLPKTAELSVVRYQLAKSSSSSGANYENRKLDHQNLILIIRLGYLSEKCVNQTIGLE